MWGKKGGGGGGGGGGGEGGGEEGAVSFQNFRKEVGVRFSP